jgi:hypothetical protein
MLCFLNKGRGTEGEQPPAPNRHASLARTSTRRDCSYVHHVGGRAYHSIQYRADGVGSYRVSPPFLADFARNAEYVLLAH